MAIPIEVLLGFERTKNDFKRSMCDQVDDMFTKFLQQIKPCFGNEESSETMLVSESISHRLSTRFQTPSSIPNFTQRSIAILPSRGIQENNHSLSMYVF